LQQPLYSAKLFQALAGRGFGRNAQVSTKIEPVHYAPAVFALTVFLKNLSHCHADEVARDLVRSPHLAFVLQFEFSGERRDGGVDVADSRNNRLLTTQQR